VVRPDGEVAEIVHAVTRASQEIVPQLKYGRPDYAAWAKRILERSDKLSALELHHLLDDNSDHFDEYEHSFPGAGVGLEDLSGISRQDRAGRRRQRVDDGVSQTAPLSRSGCRMLLCPHLALGAAHCDRSATALLDVAQRTKSIVFEVEEPFRVVERLLSPGRDDRLYAGKGHPADMALSVDLVHEAGPYGVTRR
jgi:hypothetical protein